MNGPIGVIPTRRRWTYRMDLMMSPHPHTYPAGTLTCTHCGLTLTDLAKQIHGQQR